MKWTIVPIELIHFRRNSSQQKHFGENVYYRSYQFVHFYKIERRKRTNVYIALYFIFLSQKQVENKTEAVHYFKSEYWFIHSYFFQLRQIVNWFLSKNKLIHANKLLPRNYILDQRWASPSQNSGSSRLESHSVEDSDSTRTREFGDVDSTVWLDSFIQTNFHLFLGKNSNS